MGGGEKSARIAVTCTWLERTSVGFAALGLVLPFAYHTPVFAPYRDALALETGGSTLELALGITAGSIAGKWTAHWAIVRHGLRARARWAWEATLAGLVAWFALDSLSSLLSGAWANVAFVNGLPLLLVIPLLLRARTLTKTKREPPALDGPARLALAATIVGCASGLAIALGMDSALFDPWWMGLADAFYPRADLGFAPPEAIAVVHAFAGPIGGSTLGQFVLLAYAIRYAHTEPWVARAALRSVLVWFGVDSAYSMLAGGTFNVVLVNLPCLVLLAPPLAWLASRRDPHDG